MLLFFLQDIHFDFLCHLKKITILMIHQVMETGLRYFQLGTEVLFRIYLSEPNILSFSWQSFIKNKKVVFVVINTELSLLLN